MRTSTSMRLLLPSLVNSASCRTCSSLACSAGFISPISSSISVPPSACSNLPMRVVAAPVKAPRSWPNSSLSSSSAGSAAQFTFTNGRLRRVDRWWMARETSSLPTPLSPRISTVTSLSATCSMTVRDAAHLLAVAPDRPVLVVAELLAQLAQLGDEAVLLDGVLDRDVERDLAQPLGIVGLDDVVGGAEAHGFDDRRGLVAARQHDDLGFRARGLQRAQRGQAVEARHHHVEQDDVGRLRSASWRRAVRRLACSSALHTRAAKGRSGDRQQTPNHHQRWRQTAFSSISLARRSCTGICERVCKQRYISPSWVQRHSRVVPQQATHIRRDWGKLGSRLPSAAVEQRVGSSPSACFARFPSTSALAQRLNYGQRHERREHRFAARANDRTSERARVMRRQLVSLTIAGLAVLATGLSAPPAADDDTVGERGADRCGAARQPAASGGSRRSGDGARRHRVDRHGGGGAPRRLRHFGAPLRRIVRTRAPSPKRPQRLSAASAVSFRFHDSRCSVLSARNH